MYYYDEWDICKEDNDKVREISSENNLSIIVSKLLYQRNIITKSQIHDFLYPNLKKLYDPYLFKDMNIAVKRIFSAIYKNEKIVIYGDYDVDGIVSTTILYKTLLSLGANVNFYIPNRFTDGYGPSIDVYKKLIAKGFQLIITVDNGITGIKSVKYAKSKNVDVIITDHHKIQNDLLPTNAYAIIHPYYPNSDYPFKDLSGAGVAFKLSTALYNRIPVELLDIVSLGTICDMVSLRDENRILSYWGLKILRHNPNLGIKILCKILNVSINKINSDDISFLIGPSLNSLGRLGDASLAVKLLTTKSIQKAQKISEFIYDQNQKRKNYVNEVVSEVLNIYQLDKNKKDKILILANKHWHEGVLGIVASKIVSLIGKPTILLKINDNGIAKGSGRSVPGFNLFKFLSNFKDQMISFGGHEMAVGLSVSKDNLKNIKFLIVNRLKNKVINSKKILKINLELNIDEINKKNFLDIQKFEPFGMDNEKPMIKIHNPKITNYFLMGKNRNHLKLRLGGLYNSIDSIGFNMGTINYDWLNLPLDIVGQFKLNVWKNYENIQFQICDINKLFKKIIDKRNVKLNLSIFSKKNIKYVFFNKLLYNQFYPIIKDKSSMFMFNDNNIYKLSNIMLVDEPLTLSSFTYFLNHQNAEEIIFVLYSKYHYVNSDLPKIFQCRKVLKYIMCHDSFNIKYLPKISNYLLINDKTFNLIMKILLEEKIIYIKDYKVVLNLPMNRKIDINNSDIYQKIKQKIQTDETLFNSSLNQIIKRLY